MPNIIRPIIEPGIYFDLPDHLYHAAEGLSCSGIKHLTVSRLNYWHKNLDPSRGTPDGSSPIANTNPNTQRGNTVR